MPARSLAAVTARLSCRAVTGLIGFWPGKSQTCGRAAFHHSRRSWSSWGDSITSRSRSPLPCSTRSIMRPLSMSDTFRFATSDTLRPARVSDAERGPVLEARRGLEEARHLLRAQHDRRPSRLVHQPQRTNEVGPFERLGEEEPQPGDGGIDGRRADLLLGHVQLKAAKVLARRLIRRTAEELREGPHVPDVVLLNLLLEPPRRHVLDHALPQPADGIVGHRKLLSRMGYCPLPYTLSARSPPLPRERFSPLARSGLCEEPLGMTPSTNEPLRAARQTHCVNAPHLSAISW